MKTHTSLLLACMIAVSSTAWAGDAEKKLDKLDTNNDGTVSRSEYDACAERMFAQADTNKDSALTSSEIEAVAKGAPHNDQKRDDMGRSQWFGQDKFQKCDTDGDGRITMTEANAARDRFFAKLDADKDGSISATELEAGHKMKKEKHD